MKFLYFITAGLLLTGTARAQQLLTLEQCRQMATERNNNLKAAQQKIEAAKARKAQAYAGGKPTVDVSATGFYFGKPLNSLLPEYGISPGVSVSQSIYAGGKVKLNKQLGDNGVQTEEEQKVYTTAEVLFNTEKAYWQVVQAGEKIRLARQYSKQLDALFTDLNNQYVAGITYKNDVLRVKVQQNDNELNLLKAKDALLLAKLNLAQVTGMSDTTGFAVSDSITGSFAQQLADTVQQGKAANRAEIRILQHNLTAAKIQESMLKADTRPSINLGLNGVSAFGKQGINPTSNANFMASWYSMLSVNIPVFDWNKRKQKVKEQQYTVAAQQFQLKEQEELISLEVRQANLQLNESARRVELSGASLEQAEENLRLSADRLKAGTIIGKDVLEAQTLWQQAYSDMIDAKVAYKISEATLRKALGNM
ncbi:Outer membrane protein TolC [Filimonas lacunae]|uniref:Outer membrane protein TolC n=1 Tax=Filimonas lacunae TaxID=477680 RepID=A0A173MA98_9BACT|nr:TolC family protein [Filimonas lacunae]BAV04484.1 outer membrane efflux protein [Filimonas lacunae]SIT31548.1 Outer membrane protein TolC [Filimonas lacunae]